MKIRTKTEVNYNSGVAGTTTGIVEGFIVSTAWMNDFQTVGANYIYATPEGVQIANGGFQVSGEDVETLYNAIKDSIPTDQDHRTTEKTKYYLAFIIEMAQTFSLDASQIELIP
jgi:hypothetical protein